MIGDKRFSNQRDSDKSTAKPPPPMTENSNAAKVVWLVTHSAGNKMRQS
jgi:hypothetical protein